MQFLGGRSGASKRIKTKTTEGGAPLPIFLAPSQLKSYITKELNNGPLTSIIYSEDGKEVVGYQAEILPTVDNNRGLFVLSGSNEGNNQIKLQRGYPGGQGTPGRLSE